MAFREGVRVGNDIYWNSFDEFGQSTKRGRVERENALDTLV